MKKTKTKKTTQIFINEPVHLGQSILEVKKQQWMSFGMTEKK